MIKQNNSIKYWFYDYVAKMKWFKKLIAKEWAKTYQANGKKTDNWKLLLDKVEFRIKWDKERQSTIHNESLTAVIIYALSKMSSKFIKQNAEEYEEN